MLRLSRTNVLTLLVVLAGVVAAVGFALSASEFGGAALGVGMALGALLIHSATRELRSAQDKASKVAAASRASIEQIDLNVQGMATLTDKVLRAHRKSMREAVAQADRIEQRTDAMTRRIIADVNAARLEAADRHAAVERRTAAAG